ncbi:MAG: hypothetical protein HAW66_02520 [Shewanella sp.]|nr:hypothetical protein [Shewanella sp.]
MSLSLQGIASPSISMKELNQISQSDSFEDAVQLTQWQRVKNWFCHSNRSQAYEALYFLTNKEYLESDAPDKAFQQIKSFQKLKSLTNAKYKGNFKAHITEHKSTQYSFNYQIAGVTSEVNVENNGFCATMYGLPDTDSTLQEMRQLSVDLIGINNSIPFPENLKTKTGIENRLKIVTEIYSHQARTLASYKLLPCSKENGSTELTDNWNSSVSHISHHADSRVVSEGKRLASLGNQPYNVQISFSEPSSRAVISTYGSPNSYYSATSNQQYTHPQTSLAWQSAPYQLNTATASFHQQYHMNFAHGQEHSQTGYQQLESSIFSTIGALNR